MKLVKLLTLALCFVAATASAQGSLPAVEVKTLEGQPVAISDIIKKDNITILSFWATWCKPCKLELDNFAELYEGWQENYNVEIIAVTIDDARQLPKVKPLVEAKGWAYSVLSDTNRDLHKALGGVDIPFTVVVQNGKIIYTHSGYKLGDEVAFEEKLKEWAAAKLESDNSSDGKND